MVRNLQVMVGVEVRGRARTPRWRNETGSPDPGSGRDPHGEGRCSAVLDGDFLVAGTADEAGVGHGGAFAGGVAAGGEGDEVFLTVLGVDRVLWCAERDEKVDVVVESADPVGDARVDAELAAVLEGEDDTVVVVDWWHG
jgi:hypothetical protein